MASTALAVYDKVGDPILFAESMALAAAKLIGCDPDQGKAMALQALADGCNIMDLKRRYHWIQGSPSMRADAMRAEFRMNYGGDFEILEDSADAAAIKFIDAKKREKIERITWLEAQGEPWPWQKGCGPGTAKTDSVPGNLKDNWATPLSRANMLIARCTSRGLRKICPELVAGIYTPEEMEDVGNAVATAVTSTTPRRPTASEIMAVQAATNGSNGHATAPVGEAIGGERVIDAEFTPAGAGAGEAATATTEAAKPAAKPIRSVDINSIRKLLTEAFNGDADNALATLLAKRNAAKLEDLSHDQAKEIIQRLRDKVGQMQAAAAAVGGASPN